MTAVPQKILAPLRGVTVRCFRETFYRELSEAGFEEAVSPFIPALPGSKVILDSELKVPQKLKLTPQFIGKDPKALEEALKKIKDIGFNTADLNAGCPYPMIRNKGRGSGLMRNRDLLERMIEVGCTVMGQGAFSVKTRLGIDSDAEIDALMPIFERYPLRFLTIHGRSARQMYDGECNIEKVREIAAAAKIKVVLNGDIGLSCEECRPVMIGRAFVRSLGKRENAKELLAAYAQSSLNELCGERAVLGRIKEFLSYWKDLPRWRNLWPVLKLARSVKEITLQV